MSGKFILRSYAILIIFISILGAGGYVYFSFFPFEASIRSPVTRTWSSLRSLSMAIQAYRIDNQDYPAWSLNNEENAFGKRAGKFPALTKVPTFSFANAPQLGTITTPIAYLISYDADPFAPVKNATFAYWNNATSQTQATGFIAWSPGPDRVYDLTMFNITRAFDPQTTAPTPFLLNLTYDPSNGTVSKGDIHRYER